jgi:cysteine synthase A
MHDQIYDNICQVIGKTPVVRLNRIAKDGWAEMLVKLESFNPGGSVKDRIGLSMIEAAEREGKLKPGGTIVEPTSGNTGIGLAMVAAAKGYKVILTMPEEYSVERITLLRAYGAQVVLTAREQAMQGAIDKAEELIRQNPLLHAATIQESRESRSPSQTTAKEILDVCGEKLDALVIGVGTGGTATGAGEVVKEKIKSLKVFAIEPADSPVFSGGKAGLHKSGNRAGFIPEIFNRKIVDRFIRFHMTMRATARIVLRAEGILCGISSGRFFTAAAWLPPSSAAVNECSPSCRIRASAISARAVVLGNRAHGRVARFQGWSIKHERANASPGARE